MKKLFILGLVFSIVGFFCTSNIAQAAESNTAVIKGAIEKYKNRNFLGCISDLKMETAKDPSSAIAWYYLGNAYMNIAMKAEAHEAFDNVVQINSVPKLTSYSIQAKICMENPARCTYQDFNKDQISQLKADPTGFLESYFANLNNDNKSEADIEIEKLINGSYGGNLHPDAKNVIIQERTKIEQSQSHNSAYIPSNDKLAEALELLKGQGNDLSAMAMILENRKQDSSFATQPTISPEMVQLMMMQNQMTNF